MNTNICNKITKRKVNILYVENNKVKGKGIVWWNNEVKGTSLGYLSPNSSSLSLKLCLWICGLGLSPWLCRLSPSLCRYRTASPSQSVSLTLNLSLALNSCSVLVDFYPKSMAMSMSSGHSLSLWLCLCLVDIA